MNPFRKLMHTTSVAALMVSGLSTSAASFAATYATSDAFAMYFAKDGTDVPSVFIEDAGTPANDVDVTIASDFDAYNNVLTYTAPSIKNVMQSDGYVKYSAHNLVTYSDDFTNTGAWANLASGSGVNPVRTADQAASPIDGNTTADRIVLDLGGGTASGDISGLRGPTTAVTGRTYSFSIYVKSFDGVSSYNMQLVDVAGTATSIVVTGTWQKFTVSGVAGATGVNSYLRLRGAQAPTNADVADVLVSAGHIHNYPADETYLPTTTAARYALPIEYDTSGDAIGVLVEPAATNLVTNSLTTTGWSKIRSTSVASANASPDGSINALSLADSVDNNSHYVSRSFTTAIGTVYTFSLHAKEDGLADLLINNQTDSEGSYFDFGDGTVGADFGSAPDAKTITSLGGGWYRATLTFTATATSTEFRLLLANSTPNFSYAGTGAALDIYGFQLETGSVATSPIVTAGSTVTRLKDQLTIATSAFPHSAVGWTIYVEWRIKELKNWLSPVALNNGTSSEETVPYSDSGGIIAVSTRDGNVEQGILAPGSIAASVFNKWVGASAANDLASSRNGGTVVTDSSATLPTVTTFEIGSRSGGSNVVNGHIKSIAYIPERVTDANLVAMTT